jgi:hypothetical protein
VSELDVAEPEGRADAILVAVPPPDGPAVIAGLRDRGFVVLEAPLHLLVARVLSEAPRVIIVDVDQPGAVEAIERVREASATIDLLCVGDPGRAAELGATRGDGRAFERPVDVEAVVLTVLALAEPAREPRGTLPPAFSRARETTPPRRLGDSEMPPASEYPSTSDPLDVAAILPAIEDAEGLAAIAPIELSPELSQLLEAAEQRVSSLVREHPSSIPSPEEELDLLAPPEMLAALDEPLDPEDDASASGASTGGTGFPKARTTGVGTHAGGTTGAPGTSAGEQTRAGRASAVPAPGSSPPPREPPIAAPYAPPLVAEVERTLAPLSVEGDAIGPKGRSAATTADTGPISVVPSIPAFPRPAPIIMAAPVTMGAPPAAPPRAVEPAAPRPAPPAASATKAAPPAAQVAPTKQPPPPARTPAPPEKPASEPPPVPRVLGDGDAVRALATVIGQRASGSIAIGPESATRRIVLHEGDIVTAASTSPDETLLAFLAARGDIERAEAARLAGKLPSHGRHAGAALIAHGHLGQDDLWPVLRAHAEWVIGRAILADEGTCEIEPEAPGRLRAEPSVFGGATGAEVLLEVIRRVIPPEIAQRRLGGAGARLAEGARRPLLAECALRSDEEQLVRTAAGRTVGELLVETEPEFADVLYGLVSLGVLDALAPAGRRESAPPVFDPLDEEAIRQRVRARLALVEDGDYFALLGIPRNATGYEIRRAYLELRRAFEPARVLTASTADLADDVRLVVEVLDEAYEILREPHRRERYRRAIEAGPP